MVWRCPSILVWRCPSIRLSVNIWLSTGVTTCQINFNITDIMHLVCRIHDTGNGPYSSLNMRILTQLLIFAFWSFLRPFLPEASIGLLTPVPLSIFRSNSKFDENSKHSSVKWTRPITTIFCTLHDSVIVMMCAKYRCDRSCIFETRAFWIFIEFQIRSKYA